MLLTLSWQQIALRLALASIASFVIGLDRDRHGKTAGMRTTMLVCLAATLAMIEANLLITTAGKTPSSFIQLDVMRLPLASSPASALSALALSFDMESLSAVSPRRLPSGSSPSSASSSAPVCSA